MLPRGSARTSLAVIPMQRAEAAGPQRTCAPTSACTASDDFRLLGGTFLQCCPEVKLDCVGSWPWFTGLSAKLHHGIFTPGDAVTDRQSPAGFSKPKHFATLTGKKKPTHIPLSLSRLYLETAKAGRCKTPQSHSSSTTFLTKPFNCHWEIKSDRYQPQLALPDESSPHHILNAALLQRDKARLG